MNPLAFVVAAILVTVPCGCFFELQAAVPWWDESLPDDATGFNCFGTLKYENGQFGQIPGFKFPEQALAPLTHPDAVCEQTGQVNGWYRQQFKWLHVKQGFVDPTTHELFCAPVGEPVRCLWDSFVHAQRGRSNLAMRDHDGAERLCAVRKGLTF